MLEKLGRIVIEKGHPADRVLARYFKDHREFGSRDRRFLSECFFSYFRWLGWTRILELNLFDSVMLSVHLDQTDIHPALDASRKEWLPLGGKSLDEKMTAVQGWFPDAPELTKSDLVFPEFEESMDWPEGGKELFYETLQQRPPTWIRLRNDLFKKVLSEANVAYTMHPVMPRAASIAAGRPLAALGCTGQYEVQDIASQAVVEVAAPQEAGDWWDACAGAGGKSLHLADKTGRDGKVFATDVREEALANCKKRSRTNGVKNIRLQLHDLAEEVPFTKEFDGVLVDAPCSGWGTWSRNPDARWRTDPRDPVQKRNLQKRMLHNAAACVKPDGVLVFAVCSITREETTEVLAHFLKEHTQFQLDAFAHPLTGAPTEGSVQIWPWEGPGDGMFIARLRRVS
jgi:16S rRNA (cytosine967-C5)-methyltransferase